MSDTQKKLREVEEFTRQTKKVLEQQSQLMRKMKSDCAYVDTFEKRVLSLEQKLETQKEQESKRAEQMKEHINRTKDMLESRVNQITQFNDVI